jgi:hypothetical protein
MEFGGMVSRARIIWKGGEGMKRMTEQPVEPQADVIGNQGGGKAGVLFQRECASRWASGNASVKKAKVESTIGRWEASQRRSVRDQWASCGS